MLQEILLWYTTNKVESILLLFKETYMNKFTKLAFIIIAISPIGYIKAMTQNQSLIQLWRQSALPFTNANRRYTQEGIKITGKATQNDDRVEVIRRNDGLYYGTRIQKNGHITQLQPADAKYAFTELNKIADKMAESIIGF